MIACHLWPHVYLTADARIALDVEKQHRSATTEKSPALSEAEWADDGDMDNADDAADADADADEEVEADADGAEEEADVDTDVDKVAWLSADKATALPIILVELVALPA